MQFVAPLFVGLVIIFLFLCLAGIVRKVMKETRDKDEPGADLRARHGTMLRS
jgi:hypothetical protein